MLGTMPSPGSVEAGFYYSHPQNRFWSVLAYILKSETPVAPADKKAFLLKNKIALWDVLASCEIENASDSTITSPVFNDLTIITGAADIRGIFTTGRKATALYENYIADKPGFMKTFYLPSTSPANRAVSFEKLVLAYKAILEYL